MSFGAVFRVLSLHSVSGVANSIRRSPLSRCSGFSPLAWAKRVVRVAHVVLGDPVFRAYWMLSPSE